MTSRHPSSPLQHAPYPDPYWTLELESEFFARLNARHPRGSTYLGGALETTPLCPAKELLLREYANHTLQAQRLSQDYLYTLEAVLVEIGEAEREHTECRISQRDSALGTRRTLRTIQAQLESAGVLIRVKRPQGHNFVGDVLVHKPNSPRYSCRSAAEEMERLFRACEGEAPHCGACPILDADVQY